MNNPVHNHLNLKTLYDVRLAKERFRYQLLENQLNLKEEISFFKDTVTDVIYRPFSNSGLGLLSMALMKIFGRKGK